MSLASRDPPTKHIQNPPFADCLVRAGRRFVAGNSEGTIVLSALIGFIAVWMLFWTVSTASVDIHTDANAAMGWARHFAFGYKHPPMTGWLYALWFAALPRQQWAVHLLNVTSLAVALGVTWRLLRDCLDKNRALLGLLALLLIPLYNGKAEVLNANTVMIPFWAATLLFYLRARRGLGTFDAFFAGAFASFTVLGKYWAVFLLAGMAVASMMGPGTRRFWRSPAPYVMAAGAALVIAPHVWWLMSDRGGASIQFAESVINHASFGAASINSANYIIGAVAYIAGPLIFLAALRPSRVALADIAWPAEEDRRQALVLLLVPLVLPAFVNLVIPYRLTPDWTFPNWALLPIVLYASRYLIVNDTVVARAGLFVVAVTLVILVASPVIACVRLMDGPEQYRAHLRQVAELADGLAGKPTQLYWGSAELADVLFYLPEARPITTDPLSAEGRAASSVHGLLVVCLSGDAPCQKTGEALANAGAYMTTVTFKRSFLGFSSPPRRLQITVMPPAQTP